MSEIEVSKAKREPATGPKDIFSAMRDEMNRVLERFEGGKSFWSTPVSRWVSDKIVPELDVRETDTAIIVEAELPGVDEKDISVTVANGYLTIKGEKRSESEQSEESYYVAERSFGSFERSLRLPDSVDESKIEASFDRGVLKVMAPKSAEAQKPERKIPIGKS
ncbi:MAG: Hsp20/alpha crystallin family protein [Hyphomicrobiaceae bacterium]|nr:Hsp20/alpha crystallin family protein [Hyphomicrobiaceae bacterium]